MSASPSTASSTSEATPRALAPLAPLSTNGLPHVQPVTVSTPTSLTNKQWIVPPRPKPGRKPATDTPPTKRKAQNRAAQRAFRERRAAKVGELEEQMKEVEEENEREKENLREQVQELEEKVGDYHRMVLDYQERLRTLESELSEERRLRNIAEGNMMGSTPIPISSTDAVPLPTRKKAKERSPIAEHQHAKRDSQEIDGEMPMGCGRCTINSRCECIEQVFNMGTLEASKSDQSPKRSHSPPATHHSLKRLRQDTHTSWDTKQEPLEIDFTTQRPPLLSTHSSTFSLPTPTHTNRSLESCGFCQDGTACLCAELAADNAAASRIGLPSLLSQPSDPSKLFTPLTLPNFSYTRAGPSKSGCPSGPGTCSQCQNNPSSTLFCKSLAATRTPASSLSSLSNLPTTAPPPLQSSPAPPCTANAASCCRTNLFIPPSEACQSTAITGPTLSCADAFTTLSRHPAFDRASGELGTWLPQLSTVPKGLEGRTAFEIEAASVMGVLRFFDRRFGRDA